MMKGLRSDRKPEAVDDEEDDDDRGEIYKQAIDFKP